MPSQPISVADFFNLESSLATEFRRILNSIQQTAKEREVKTLLVTSATLSEGKSTVCSFLAMTAAKKGVKTLLIDADLRRPSLHRVFATTRDQGVSEILSDGIPGKKMIKKTSLDKLDLITAGKVAAHPAEVFDARILGQVLAEMKFYYDLVIVDGAPILPVSDPMLLAPEVDGIVIVIKAGSTQRDVVSRARDILGASTNKILGVVLNNVDASLPTHYDSTYQEYNYSQKGTGSKKSTPQGSPRGESPTGNSKSTGTGDTKKEPSSGNTVPR